MHQASLESCALKATVGNNLGWRQHSPVIAGGTPERRRGQPAVRNLPSGINALDCRNLPWGDYIPNATARMLPLVSLR
jgi:hypothetical protein